MGNYCKSVLARSWTRPSVSDDFRTSQLSTGWWGEVSGMQAGKGLLKLEVRWAPERNFEESAIPRADLENKLCPLQHPVIILLCSLIHSNSSSRYYTAFAQESFPWRSHSLSSATPWSLQGPQYLSGCISSSCHSSCDFSQMVSPLCTFSLRALALALPA